jgi:hypothetical protein
MKSIERRSGPTGLVLVLLVWIAGQARADLVTLHFEDVALPPTGLGSLIVYDAQGYTLASTSGFSSRGPGTDSSNYTPETSPGSGVVSTSLAAFSPGTITLVRDDGGAFNLDSIDLAREFRFNTPDVGQAYPVVTFTGVTSGGGLVTESFTADQAGFSFATFAFSSDFTGLLSVSWQQPPFTSGTPTNPAPGLHQFDNLMLSSSAVAAPEPSTVALALSAVPVGIAGWLRRRRRVKTSC